MILNSTKLVSRKVFYYENFWTSVLSLSGQKITTEVMGTLIIRYYKWKTFITIKWKLHSTFIGKLSRLYDIMYDAMKWMVTWKRNQIMAFTCSSLYAWSTLCSDSNENLFCKTLHATPLNPSCIGRSRHVWHILDRPRMTQCLTNHDSGWGESGEEKWRRSGEGNISIERDKNRWEEEQ